MDEIKHKAQAETIEGQTTLPGFDDPKPEPAPAETIKMKIATTAYKMDMLKDPEDTLAAWPDALTRYLQTHFSRLVDVVAELTGADPEQIADKDKRTPEQQKLLTEAAAQEQISRIEVFLASRYMQALNVLQPLTPESATNQEYYHSTLYDNEREEFADRLHIKEQAVLYFFATHTDLNPIKKDPLTEEQKEALKDIFCRLDAFYLAHSGEYGQDDLALKPFYAFIEHENPSQETAESIVATIKVIDGLRPTSHTMPNNPLMNALQQKNAINAGAFDLPVSNGKGRRKEITVYTMVTYDPGDTGILITDAKLTEYERQVSDAVISLWAEATEAKLPTIFTVDQIFRAMPGGSDKPSAQQKGAITKTLEKFNRLHIYMNATEEMRRRRIISDTQQYIVDENYLQWRRHTVTTRTGKKIAQGYEILGQPIMLTYSKLTRQLLTVPAKNIEIEKVKGGKPSGELIAMTPERQAMTGYIIRRIETMRHDLKQAKENKRKYDAKRKNDKTLEEKPLSAFREQSEIILFDTLFTEAGANTTSRDRTMDNRNFCFDVLEYQKAIGAIKGYSKQTKGRSITGVKILF
jgi:hypothetical protein